MLARPNAVRRLLHNQLPLNARLCKMLWFFPLSGSSAASATPEGESHMKNSKWLLGAVAICLLIAGVVPLTKQRSTFPQSGLVPGYAEHSAFSPAVADWHVFTKDTAPPPEPACFALGVRCFQ